MIYITNLEKAPQKPSKNKGSMHFLGYKSIKKVTQNINTKL